MNEEIMNYISEITPPDEEWIKELKQQATADRVPIMESSGIEFLLQLIRLNKPKRILEVGTAIGYSALRMHHVNPESEIVTIEKDENRYKQAIENITKHNKHTNVQVIHGDALEEIEKLVSQKEKFQCIFIDAAKGQYKRFFELSSPLLQDNGFIITDNVLFRGYVANPDFEHPRYKKMVEKIRAFNQWLMNHPDYVTTILPIGDGVAVSYKK
ncbi:methyltransferase domain-containing protein [Ornithinibacillus sp. L9]|uniref:tRNA 5-hydroxyuridine methyltransferase n=1 Tax=Ornithinibacillus caprae TaxID=2678566 RepID=A0A6N8FBU5_9BACI|nr:O-methyltransferase [Ornithinibacillus caprae]MUK87023.1 methyltransferase domain-containing protein [Ornithinibacillus caprae]